MTPEGVAAPARKPSRDETLVKALVRAHRWRRKIESGRAKSITDLAEHEGVTDAYVCRLLPLTCLAPDIVEAILDGRQPKGLRLAEVLGTGRLHGRSREALGALLNALHRLGYDPAFIRRKGLGGAPLRLRPCTTPVLESSCRRAGSPL
jgi:hypothetical protein